MGNQILDCACGAHVEVGDEARAVTCWRCVGKNTIGPRQTKNVRWAAKYYEKHPWEK